MAQKKKKSNKGKTKQTTEISDSSVDVGASASISISDAKKMPQLPLEIILDILEISAYLLGTRHARNICLVTKVAHKKCWPALHRVVTLRTPDELDKFSRSLYAVTPDKNQIKLRRSALRHLYMNNNKTSNQGHQTSLGDSRGLVLILAQAENLKTLHFEEYWSVTNDWVNTDDTPARLIDEPLQIMTCFPQHMSYILDNNKAFLGPRWSHVPSSDVWKPKDWKPLVPKLQELTISAESFSLFQLKCFGKNYWTDVWGGSYPGDDEEDWKAEVGYRKIAREDGANFAALSELTHLHLYFAKMDMMTNKLLGMVQALPKLTHLRLTRPSSFYMDTTDLESETAHHGDLGEAVEVLLDLVQSSRVRPKSKTILIQIGPDFGQLVLEKLLRIQMRYPSRLQVFAPSGIRPLKMTKAQKIDKIDKRVDEMLGYGLKKSEAQTMIVAMDFGRKVTEIKVVDTEEEVAAGLDKASVTDGCEERAFHQFAERVAGGTGVWSKEVKCLW